jgi:Ni,Fe-hydrogenase I small subunit
MAVSDCPARPGKAGSTLHQRLASSPGRAWLPDCHPAVSAASSSWLWLDVRDCPGSAAAMMWTLRPQVDDVIERMTRGVYHLTG